MYVPIVVRLRESSHHISKATSLLVQAQRGRNTAGQSNSAREQEVTTAQEHPNLFNF